MGAWQHLYRTHPFTDRRFAMNDTLLIIEDNEQNFYLMRFLLEKMVYNHWCGRWQDRNKNGLSLHNPWVFFWISSCLKWTDMRLLAELKKHEALDGVPYHRRDILCNGWRQGTYFGGRSNQVTLKSPINPETLAEIILNVVERMGKNNTEYPQLMTETRICICWKFLFEGWA